MQAAHRVAKNTGILYARMAITVFISLYATRLVLAALGIKDFGIFNVVGGAISMLMFLNNAMSGATQRFMSFAEGQGNTEKQKSIFNVSLVLHIITAILAVLLLETLGYFLFDGILKIPIERIEAAKLIYHFLVISTFFTVVSVPYDAVINAHENMLLVAILGIIEAVIKLLIAVFITHFLGDKLIVYGLLMAALSVLLLIIRQLYCHKKYVEVIVNIRLYFDKPLFKEMTLFAGWSLLGCSSSMIGTYGLGIVLNMFFGTVVNAAQGIANQISGQLGTFATTMLKALNPLIAKSEGSGNRNLMVKTATMGSKFSFLLLMFFVIPVFIEMPFIFKLWLKDVPDYTIIFCRLFLIKNLIDQIFVTLNSVVAAVGNIKKYQIVVSFLYFLPLPVTYTAFKLGFPPYSLYIVGILLSIVSGFYNLYFTSKNCELPFEIFLKQVVLRVIVTFGSVYILTLIPIFVMAESVFRLMIVFLTSSLFFLIFTWKTGLTVNEKNSVSVMFKTIIQKKILKK